jgi:hypothetical protein
MKNSTNNNFRENLAAISLAAAPILLLTGDLTGFAPDLYFAHYLLAKAGLAAFVFAVIVLIEMLRPHSDRLGLIGGGMAIIGAISGTTLFSFAYFYKEMGGGGFDAATWQSFEQVFSKVYLVMVFAPLPGLFFPLGLITLSVGLFKTKVVSRWAAIALGLGAFLFPVGRIPGILPVSIASDVFLALSLCFIGWQMLARSSSSRRHEKFIADAAIIES